MDSVSSLWWDTMSRMHSYAVWNVWLFLYQQKLLKHMYYGFLFKAVQRFLVVIHFVHWQLHRLLIHSACYSSQDSNLKGSAVKCGCCLQRFF